MSQPEPFYVTQKIGWLLVLAAGVSATVSAAFVVWWLPTWGEWVVLTALPLGSGLTYLQYLLTGAVVRARRR